MKKKEIKDEEVLDYFLNRSLRSFHDYKFVINMIGKTQLMKIYADYLNSKIVFNEFHSSSLVSNQD